jgi:CheY-like chemotaxis protein
MGLMKLKNKKPDLIILDVMMETRDEGFNFARKLKKDEEYKAIPILMLTAIKESTGFDFKSEVGDDKWLPVDDYCDKLVKMEELMVKIEKLLHT